MFCIFACKFRVIRKSLVNAPKSPPRNLPCHDSLCFLQDTCCVTARASHVGGLPHGYPRNCSVAASCWVFLTFSPFPLLFFLTHFNIFQERTEGFLSGIRGVCQTRKKTEVLSCVPFLASCWCTMVSADHYVRTLQPLSSGISVSLENTKGISSIQTWWCSERWTGYNDDTCVMFEKDDVWRALCR